MKAIGRLTRLVQGPARLLVLRRSMRRGCTALTLSVLRRSKRWAALDEDDIESEGDIENRLVQLMRGLLH